MEAVKLQLLPNREIRMKLTSPELHVIVRWRKGKAYLDVLNSDGSKVQTIDLTKRGDSAQFAIGTQPPG